MADRRFIPDIIEGLIPRVRELYDPDNLEKPYFLHGHIKDVLAVLSNKDKSGTLVLKKYPLVILIEDIEENDNLPILYESVSSPQIIICTRTKSNYHAPARYDNSFRTILQPITGYLKQSISESKDIENHLDDLVNTKINRVYWGTLGAFGVDASILNDNLDAIEFIPENIKILKYEEPCESLN